MTLRHGRNCALGLPALGTVSDTADCPLGTISNGYDDVAGTSAEYIYLRSPANIAIADDVDFDANFLATEVGAGAGGAVAVVASGVNQYAFFRLRARPQA